MYVVLGSATAFGALETAVAFAPSFPVTALLLLPTGFSMVHFVQASYQHIQLGVDAAHRGRVTALVMLLLTGTVGYLLAGWLSERYGPRTAVGSGGFLCVFAATSLLAWQLRRSGDRIALRPRPWPWIRVVEQPVASVTARASAGP